MEQKEMSKEEFVLFIRKREFEIRVCNFIKGFLFGALCATVVILLFMLMR